VFTVLMSVLTMYTICFETNLHASICEEFLNLVKQIPFFFLLPLSLLLRRKGAAEILASSRDTLTE
jgi:hypothetical protein